MLQYFEKILMLKKAYDVLYKMRYILWVEALLGGCSVIQDGHPLGFYQKLEIIERLKKLKNVNAGHVEYDVIKHFAAFCQHFGLFSFKKGKNTFFFKNGLTTCYL